MRGEYITLLPSIAKYGIQPRFSYQYTNKQNEISERKHRHVTEIGLTLLSHANIPLSF